VTLAAITKGDLRLMLVVLDGFEHLAKVPGSLDGLPREHWELLLPPRLQVRELHDKVARAFAETVSARTWGAKVFECRFPLFRRIMLKKPKAKKVGGKTVVVTHFDAPIAPTLNAYQGLQPYMQAKIRKEVDTLIMAELQRWPAALLRGRMRPRAVRVTRFSSSMPDEISADVIGGKIPIDRCVEGGILMGDRKADLERDAVWKPVAPGEGALLLEVFELVL
jgi:hypothetical protein